MYFDQYIDVYSETFPEEVLLVEDTPIPDPNYWQDVDGDNILDVNDNEIEVI